ncbi:MAG: hypothetical protein KDE27_10485 [Planctomycetes bacterium]|nr:hypothetical protein [Planctomycetota bacterium]
MSTPCPAPVYRAVTYVHVASVEVALEFYALLGFTPGFVLRPDGKRAVWAKACSRASGVPGSAEMFFARASGPIAADQQAVLFYMYSQDVADLRAHLLASGLFDGGVYRGQAGPNGGRRVVFEIYHPPHMERGELRVVDPDGYVILVGQLE